MLSKEQHARSLFLRCLALRHQSGSRFASCAPDGGGASAALGASLAPRTFTHAAEAWHELSPATPSSPAALRDRELRWENETSKRKGLHDAHQRLVALLTVAREEGKQLPPSIAHMRAPWTQVKNYVAATWSDSEMQDRWARQIDKETKALDEAVAQYTKEMEELRKAGRAASTAPVEKLVLRWYEPMVEAIENEVQQILKGKAGLDRKAYGPLLLTLEPKQLAVLTITGVMNTLLLGGDERQAGQAKLTKTSLTIGKMVQLQTFVKKVEDDIKELNNQKAVLKRAHRDLQRLYWQRVSNDPWLMQEMVAAWEGQATSAGQKLQRVLGALYGENEARVWEELGELLALVQRGKPELEAKAEARMHDLAAMYEALRGGPPGDAGDAGADALMQDLWAMALSRMTARLAQYYTTLGESRPQDVLELFDPDYQTRLLQKLKPKRVAMKKGTTPRTVERMVRRAKWDTEFWTPDKMAKVGTVLIKLLVDSATITTPLGELPAFVHDVVLGYDTQRKGFWKKYGTLMCHDEVLMQIEQGQQARASFLPRYLPMVVPPLPWSRHNHGAYLTFSSPVMRVRGEKDQLLRLKQQDDEMLSGRGLGMQRVYNALNALGGLAWRINTPVLDIVERVWAHGGGIAGLPSKVNLVEPVPPSSCFRLVNANKGQLLVYSTGETAAEAKVRFMAAQRVRKKNAELHSLRCDTELKLKIAQQYRDDEFYYPHNVDFRGRAYPMHPHLNHLGSDVCRGVMRFAEARALGPTGLDWLQVHLANLYGGGKMSLTERRAFVQQHMDEVFDSADDPLGGRQWWMGADEPFQCLAACMEIAQALRSGNPENYMSFLPVYQDGSCNGLQHYAALGRDYLGGKAVNLVPADRPQDVYTEIAKLVQRKVEEDAAQGHRFAVALQGHVDRKLVKQTVMTSVYGVTFIGARGQISNRLVERGWEDNHQTYKIACYAAKITLDALHEMFSNAKEIMAWLAECARLIAKQDHAVEWTTPLGLPVVQPYRKKDRKHVRTILQRMVLVGSESGDHPVMKARQRSAFPPNYVHSIDSSHMMMTAIKCAQQGIAFAGVHDSFWTHAGSVGSMNDILREQFVELHSQGLLEHLLRDFRTNPKFVAAGIEFPNVPQLGELDVQTVQDSQYFFS